MWVSRWMVQTRRVATTHRTMHRDERQVVRVVDDVAAKQHSGVSKRQRRSEQQRLLVHELVFGNGSVVEPWAVAATREFGKVGVADRAVRCRRGDGLQRSARALAARQNPHRRT